VVDEMLENRSVGSLGKRLVVHDASPRTVRALAPNLAIEPRDALHLEIRQ
jgi:hypothetical protein